MAEEGANTNVNVLYEQKPSEGVETTDRGFFDFMKKDADPKPAQGDEVIATEFENKVQVSTPEYKPEEQEKKHESLLEKLHRSDSSSSSSSEDEEDDEEAKKRKREKKEKKSLKEKLKEKLPGHKDEHVEDTSVPVEKVYEEHKPHVQEVVYSEPSHPAAAPLEPEEKKGIFDKLKEKLPGQHKKPEEQEYTAAPVVTPAAPVATEHYPEGEAKEKKGFLDKIKDKIPGFHSKTEEEEKKGEKKESD